MMFKIKGGDFSRKLGMIQGVVEKRTTMPILSHVLVSSTDKGLLLEATDLENTAIVSCDAQTEGEFKMAVPAGILSDLVREIKEEEEISVTATENNWIEVVTSSGSFKIAGLAADDFPRIPEVSSDDLFQISSETLEEMISKTVFSVSDDEKRRSLSGVFFEKRGEQTLRLVATDGHRLSYVDQKVEGLNFSKDILVPKKAVMEIRRLLRLSKEVRIGSSGNFFVFELKDEDLVFISRVIDAEFPDYMQVVPVSTKNTVRVDAAKLLLALRRVSLFSADNVRGGGRFVEMAFGEGSLLLGAYLNTGEGKESMPVEYSGEEVRLGFNFTYFQDVLDAVGSPEVMIGFSGHKNPVYVVPCEEGEKQDGYVNVIMPMELDARAEGQAGE
jgi:DNA polymerase-3 subunit beta